MMSLTSVVAASSTEAPAPRVAFTRMFQAPSQTRRRRARGTRARPGGPRRRMGSRNANSTNGRSIDIRVRKKRGGIAAIADQRHQDGGVDAERPHRGGRCGHDRQDEEKQAGELYLRRRAMKRAVPVVVKGVGVGPAHAVRRLRRTDTNPRPTPNTTTTPMAPATIVPRRSLSMPPTP